MKHFFAEDILHGLEVKLKLPCGFVQILVIVFGAICLAMVGVASGLGGIIEAGFSANGILLGPLLALFTMGWGCPWVNSKVRSILNRYLVV